uniref:Golgi to ER traffic protein 4 n=1 Tax=Anopheles farauti TaxID=69004 RepID=A0A182QJG8_9DIPT
MATQADPQPISRVGSRGVSRVLAKLRASTEAGNFYEAHQMYRTLHFRFVSQERYEDLLDLLYDGAMTMVVHEQYSIGADLGLMIISTLDVAPLSKPKQQSWVKKVADLLGKIKPTVVEREALLEKAIKWSGKNANNELDTLMHRLVAQMMYREGNLAQARYHFLHSQDGKSSAFLLIEMSTTKGFPGEVDLFVALFVLGQLCLGAVEAARDTFATYCQFHPAIACSGAPYPLPLLNFLWILLQLVKPRAGHVNIAAFRWICDLYKPSILRDPVYKQYMQKIHRRYFYGGRPEASPYAFFDFMQQLMIDRDLDFLVDEDEHDEADEVE